MKINLIVCVDNNYGIGKYNTLPWHYTKDFQFFKDTTTSHILKNKNQLINNKHLKNVVIMGYNTYISIPETYRPLKNRINIILTKKQIIHESNENIIYFNNILSILYYLHKNNKNINNVWIAGGATIYKQFLDLQIIDYIYMTTINKNFQCDTFFPNKYLKCFNIIDKELYFDFNKLSYSIKKDQLEILIYQYQNKDEIKYLQTIQKILLKGTSKIDRTKIGTLSIFGKSFKYNIKNYRLPLFTHRKMFFRGIVEELLFFISGKTNTKLLEDKNVNIWKGNTSREFLDSQNLQNLKEGDMGAGYPFQLRHFGANYLNADADYTGQGFDQINYIVDQIKNNPTSRRILFSYWNPADLNKVALPSCFLKNTLVLTQRGYIQIQNVTLSDLVLTHNGNWKPINNIQYKLYNDKIYTIMCRHNNKLINVTKEHPFYVAEYSYNNSYNINTNMIWCKAEDLNINKHLLCMPINKIENLHSINLYNNIKPISLDQCYLLGYFLKNGFIKTITNSLLTTKKYYIYVHIDKDEIYDFINIHFHLLFDSNINNYNRYLINNKEWCNILDEFGNKVYNKKIPEWVQNLPKINIMKFLQGFNDANHIINNRIDFNKIFKIISSNVAFGLQRLYAKLKIYMTLKYNKYNNSNNKARPHYILEIIKDSELIDNNFMYFQISDIYSITKNIDVYNFEVADDNSYIVQNIAVHNCHLLYQFYVNQDKNELSCNFYQRSSDFVLAANFNIVSAAVLTFMLCHITGYNPGKIIHNIGDIHIYNNHIDETKKMLNNYPHTFPILHIKDDNKLITKLEDFKYEHFKVLLYNSYDKYAFSMAV